MAGTPFGGLGAPNMEQIAAMGIQGPNMNPQVGVGSTPCSLHVGQAWLIPSSLLIRLFLQTSWSSCSPWIQSKKRSLPLAARLYSAGVSILEDSCRLNPLAAGLNLSPGLKTDASSKEIEEAMKRVREAQSLISAAIEPGSEFSPPLSPRCFSCLSRFYHQA